jgi:hypothetical protein
MRNMRKKERKKRDNFVYLADHDYSHISFNTLLSLCGHLSLRESEPTGRIFARLGMYRLLIAEALGRR